jgi:hypothetical protein
MFLRNLAFFPFDMVGNARAFYAIGPLCDYFLALLFPISADYLSSTCLFVVSFFYVSQALSLCSLMTSGAYF